MAYVSKEKKAAIAAELKQIMPQGWKFSLAVHNHSMIVLTISAAPVDLVAACLYQDKGAHIALNHHYLDRAFDGDLLATFEAFKTALNIGNHDRSDSMTDYFDVGHYVNMQIGKWDKPFQMIGN